MSTVQIFTYRSKIAAQLSKIPQNSKHEVQKIIVPKHQPAKIELKEGTTLIIKKGHSSVMDIFKKMFAPNKIEKPIELCLHGKGDAFVSGNHKIVSNEAGYIKSRATGDMIISNAQQVDIQNATKVKVSNTKKLANIEANTGDIVVGHNQDETLLTKNQGHVLSYCNIGHTQAYGNKKDVNILYNIGDAEATNSVGNATLEGNLGISSAIGNKKDVTFINCKDRVDSLNDGEVNIIN